MRAGGNAGALGIFLNPRSALATEWVVRGQLSTTGRASTGQVCLQCLSKACQNDGASELPRPLFVVKLTNYRLWGAGQARRKKTERTFVRSEKRILFSGSLLLWVVMESFKGKFIACEDSIGASLEYQVPDQK